MFDKLKKLFTRGSTTTPSYEFGGMDFSQWIEYQKEHGAKQPLQNPVFFRGVDLIASSISNLPIDVLAPSKYGSNKDKLPKHPAAKLLKRIAIHNVDGRTFIRSMLVNAIQHGNGYAAIGRQGSKPISLKLLDPQQMSIKVDSEGEVSYLYYHDGEFIPFFAYYILHVKGLSDDGYMGLPLLDLAKITIGAAQSIQSFTHYYFENDCRPSYWVRVPGTLKTTEAKQD